ncbi:TniB family NTP-binding protein [Acinetobacter sp. NS-4]|uniref:TniB family NTP-binding protein n=1 Tax=Acinetobacter sp. NS-4 TaxID=3127956 RepID=UPI00307CD779
MNNYTHIQTLAKLRNFVCHHSDFSNALNAIEECRDISYINNQPVGCLLLGEGGVGKSMLCRVIRGRNKPYHCIENNVDKYIVPAFYVAVPSPITIKSIAIRMLQELGCTDIKSTSADLNYRLRILLKECKTQLIMLDEFHHLYSSSVQNKSTCELVANWIKTLADETQISICLAGLPNIQDNLFIDSQLARRFSRVLKLNPLTLNIHNEAGTLKPFLKQTSNYISENINIKFDPEITTQDLLKRIFLATSGYEAYVMELLYQSCLNALKNDRFVVSMSDFNEAYTLKNIKYKPMTQKNIFQLSPNQVTEILI